MESTTDHYTSNLIAQFHGDTEITSWLQQHWLPEEIQHGLDDRTPRIVSALSMFAGAEVVGVGSADEIVIDLIKAEGVQRHDRP